MRKMIVLFTLLTAWQCCIAQHSNDQNESTTWDHHADDIDDSLVKSEITLFKLTHTIDPSKFAEIPLKKCNDKGAFFSKGSTYIDLYFKRDETNSADAIAGNALDSIFVVLHSHYWVPLPRESYQKINSTPSCAINAVSKKSVASFPHYKAFQSKDGRRIYIYISGGAEGRKYDAIWVLVNGRFYARAFDMVKV
jgi:hypothetical protein